MFWKKKKRMIDVRELQRRGKMAIPRDDIVVPTDKEGFVELNPDQPISPTTTSSTTESNDNFFNFMDNPTPTSTTSTGSNNSRKISTQLSDLDNKIYKLEQRIELLERKAGV